MLRRVSDNCLRLCPSHSDCLMWDAAAFLQGLLCMYVHPGILTLARAVTDRTQPAGALGFDPSVIDARARRYGRV